MPLRDHFRPPVSRLASWEGFHAMWPALMVQQLSAKLPPNIIAEPRVILGEHRLLENETDSQILPTFAVDTELGRQYSYEVLFFDLECQRRLVATIEFVCPANKHSAVSRRLFVSKCATRLLEGACIAIVDLITTHSFNLYSDVLELMGIRDPNFSESSGTYAVTCRSRANDAKKLRIESWASSLRIGEPLPVLPIWLSDDIAVSVDFESSYEAACHLLKISA